MTAFGPASFLGVHPDLVQWTSKLVQANKRYELYSGACYVLYARADSIRTQEQFTGTLFTSEDPDRQDADANRCTFDTRSPLEPPVPVPARHGVYVETTCTIGHIGYITVAYVRRADYAPAFPAPECLLKKAWDGSDCAPGAFLSNFDQGQPEQEPWANDGAAAEGVPLITQGTDILCTQDGESLITMNSYD